KCVKSQTPRQAKRGRDTKIPQFGGPPEKVGDEAVHKELDNRMERAATTASSLKAEQDSEAQTRFEAASKQSNDPPLSRVNTLGSGEDSMKLKELIEFCTKLFERALDLLNLQLPILVYAARHTLTAVRHKLMLPGITYYCWARTVNGERQIQALVDKKKVIITETSIRSNLKLDDAEETDFFLDKQVEGMTRHKEVYVTTSHTKKVFANMKRPGKGFSGRVTPLFPTMMIQALEDMGEDSAAPSDSHSTPIISQPSSSKPQKKMSRRKQRKDSDPLELVPDEAHVSTPSCDPPQSREDSMQLSELMNLYTSLQEKVLDLEKSKTAQAKEIASLKKRVKQLEKKRKLRTPGLKRLRKFGSTSRVESSNDVSLGDQEDASKHERKIANLDADAEVTLVDETHEMNDDNLMFDIVSAADLVTAVGEVVTTASASVKIPDELTLAQTLIEIKTTKPKPITTIVTTITSVRPRAKGIIFHDQEEQPEIPLKKKDQVALDEEMARYLKA
ncbi:hypothetical protein Tco_0490608, partial [Tanacetum coccineum]